MGSEMCIRDRCDSATFGPRGRRQDMRRIYIYIYAISAPASMPCDPPHIICLLLLIRTWPYGKSDANIWILKGWEQGEPPSPAPVLPPLRARFVYRIFHMNFPKKCPVAFQWPVRMDSCASTLKIQYWLNMFFFLETSGLKN